MAAVPASHTPSRHPAAAIRPFDAQQPETVRLYPLRNYTFGVKDAQPEEDGSVKDRLRRLEEYYEQHGMRRTCEAVLICHEYNHPHVLMLQIANAFFKLPGDHIAADVDEIAGLKERLDERLAPTGSFAANHNHTNHNHNHNNSNNSNSNSNNNSTEETDGWNITHTLAQWYRPNFETFMYPYLPAHVTRPKECKKLYFVQLPAARTLSVPKNMKLLAVPLFELYENSQRYGPQLSALPHYLSRFRWEFVDEQGDVVAWTPGGQTDARPPVRVLAGGTETTGVGVGVDANGVGVDGGGSGGGGDSGDGSGGMVVDGATS